jgi:hypothetical protein
MESNHFVMGQLKTFDIMKDLPMIVANDIANELKIEEDKLKEKRLTQ